jgi:hypothetical protein
MLLALLSSAVALGVSGGHLTADGAPFFPILASYQCGASAQDAAASGINLFVEQPYTACSWAQPNNFALDPPPAGVSVLADEFSNDAPGAGWYLPDEPDALGLTPPELPHPAAPGKLRFINFSQHFYSGQALIRPGYDKSEYTRLAAAADVVGFDLYPIVKFCGRVPLLDVFRAQRELTTIYAPGKPTFQWIETGAMTGECPTIDVTPAIANAEAWLAVAGGAVGIAWFTSSWQGAVWDRWDVSAEMLAQIAATDAQLQALAPVLLAPVGTVATLPRSTVAASSRTLDGALYVIAVNSSATPTTTVLRVDGLAGRMLIPLDESRRLRPTKGILVRDSFAPYEVRIYRAVPSSRSSS